MDRGFFWDLNKHGLSQAPHTQLLLEISMLHVGQGESAAPMSLCVSMAMSVQTRVCLDIVTPQRRRESLGNSATLVERLK